jgi:uncharacterized protein (DUF2267 family)
VKYDEFVESVAERAEIPREEAERASISVLQELCDRLSGKEAHDLLAQLPARLKTAVIAGTSVIPISAEEFVGQVASELGVSRDEALRRIRAVFATLRDAVTWGELQDVLMELDPEYANLLA